MESPVPEPSGGAEMDPTLAQAPSCSSSEPKSLMLPLRSDLEHGEVGARTFTAGAATALTPAQEAELVAGEGSDSPSELLSPVNHRLRLQGRRSGSKALGLGRKTAVVIASTLLALAVVGLRLRLGVPGTPMGGNHIFQQTLVRLWSNTCPADNPVVQQLRQQPWPNRKKGKAPQVSKITYINMKWDPMRREYMERQLRNLSHVWRRNVSLTWDRLEGVGASHLQKDKAYAGWQEKGFSRAPFPKVAGDWAIAGCAYSHYSAIKQIPENSEELVMIVEDDVEIKANFPSLWEDLWQWMPDDWDVIRVGWFGDHQNCSQVVNSYVDYAAWQQLPDSVCMYCGAQAYIVNPKSKQRVLERFEKARITHADMLLSAPTPLQEDPEKVPPLKAFVAWPLLAQTHFGKDGFPAFMSDRIHGHAAVATSTQAATTEERSSRRTTSRATTTSGQPATTHAEEGTPRVVIRMPTKTKATTTSSTSSSSSSSSSSSQPAGKLPGKLPGQDAAATKKAARLAAELDLAKEEAAAARKKAESLEEEADEAQEAAKEAEEHARASLRKKAERLAKAADEKVKEARESAEAEAEKETNDALDKAHKANSKVVERLKAVEDARKQAEKKAAEVEKRAREALQEAMHNASAAEAWKSADEQAKEALKEAEAMERKALRHALKADREREKMRGEAAKVLQALDAVEAQRKSALAALKVETEARKKAEEARKAAEAKLRQKLEQDKATTLVPPLPGLVSLPPMPGSLPPMPTLPPLATLPPVSLAPLPAVLPPGPQKLSLLLPTENAALQAGAVVK